MQHLCNHQTHYRKACVYNPHGDSVQLGNKINVKWHPSWIRPPDTPPVVPLTSSVWDVCAVKGCAFPPVENEGVLQQVQRGESVSAQSWEDEVQKTAHASLQIRPVSSWLSLGRIPPESRATTVIKQNWQTGVSLSLTQDKLISVFLAR